MFRTEDKYINRSADNNIYISNRMNKFYTFKNTLPLIGKINSRNILSDGLALFQNLLGSYTTCVKCKRSIILLDFVSKNWSRFIIKYKLLQS